MTQRTSTATWPCPIARAVDEIGDGWTLLIVRDAYLGARRFDHFQRSLGIGRNILTDRLAQLIERGVFVKRLYSEHPPRYEYRLTDKGRDIWPVLAAMASFSDRWLTGPDGPPIVYEHATCGHDYQAQVVCSECGEQLDVRATRAHRGPGFPADVTDPRLTETP